MELTQITIQSFFTSNGCDYAMAIDRNKDVMLFTDRMKAEEKFNELIDKYTSMYNRPNEFICYGCNMCTVIYHNDEKTSRTYISLDPKETL